MKTFDKKNIEDILPLTPMQEGMLFHYLKDTESDIYFEQLSLNISGKIDFERFKKAWNFVVETNEMLRAVFRWEKIEHPIQIILKKHQLQPKFHDLSGKKSSQKKRWVENIKNEDRKERFDLREVPFRVALCKVEENKYEMIISNHHILYDGWSNGIILKEFFTIYNDLVRKRTPQKPIKCKFKEFIKWQSHQDKKEEEKYWKEYLNGLEEPLELSVKIKSTARVELNKWGNLKISIKKDTREQIEAFIHRQRITMATLLYHAWGILLQRYNNTNSVIFGTTVSGRSAKIEGIENTVGLFINTLPLLVDTVSREKTTDSLKRINETLQMRAAYENTSLVKIKQYYAYELSPRGNLFDSIVVIENYPLDKRLKEQMVNNRLVIDSYSIFEISNYDLTVAITFSEDIAVNFVYNGSLFEKDVIRRLSGHFINTLEAIITNPENESGELEILSLEEKREILVDFNDTESDYPRTRTLQELFTEQAVRRPDHIALIETAGSDDPGGNVSITYSQLEQKSNQLCHLLREKSVKLDSPVTLMMERSIEMIIGILGILKAGGAYLPIDVNYPQERINYILTDSASRILLTKRDYSNEIKFEKEIIYISDAINPSRDRFKIIPTSDRPSFHPSHSSCLAYLIYTSGSTGKPKGVLIRHRGVVNMVWFHREVFAENPRSRISQVASASFDAMAFEIWPCLLAGATLCIIDNETRIDPRQLKEWLVKHQITISFQPTQMAERLLEEEWPKTGTALKALRAAGDKLNSYPMSPYPFRFYNLYGPTEDTIWTTWAEVPLKTSPETKPPPIGKPTANKQVYILSQGSKLQPLGVVGELCITGEGLARGYLNRPELTAEKFDRNLWDYLDYHDGYHRPYRSYKSYTIYKTGDLARWLPGGNIEFLGRIDHQVKIRGFRIELGEIENHLLKDKKIKEAVVTAREDEKGDKSICAYLVVRSPITFNALRQYLSKNLPDYMIPSYYVMLDKMPLTPSGKIDLKALPEPEVKIGTDYTAPRDGVEKKLTGIWADVLGIEKNNIGIDSNFFKLGGHSLKATLLISRIHKELKVKLPLAEIFETPTIRHLSRYIRGEKRYDFLPIAPVEKKEYYPLSSAQKRLYILQQMEADNTSYNLPGVVILEGELKREKIEEVFTRLISRHESLRTSLRLVDELPVQVVHDAVEFEIQYDQSLVTGHGSLVNCQGRGEIASPIKVEKIIRDFIRPFDLSQAPLLRVGLIKLPHTPTAPGGQPGRGTYIAQDRKVTEDKYLLIIDMHHIVTDGTSQEIFTQDFMALYENKREELPPLRLQYKDFAQWQNSDTQREAIKKQEEYWTQQFTGEIPVLQLPTDYSRPAVQSFAGGTIAFEIKEKAAAGLNQMALEKGISLYMVLLALYTIFLAKLTGQEDIVVGTPVAARRNDNLQEIIGMFVNTLGIRNYPGGEKTFNGFLEEIKVRTLAAFENQDYPFEELVEKVEVNRDTGRSPLFDVMFILQNIEQKKIEIPGLKLMPYDYENRTSKFDLSLHAVEIENGILFKFEYRTKLFRPGTIERFTQYFREIVHSILKNPEQEIWEIEILPESEKRLLLYELNDTAAEYPGDKTLHELFEEQAAGSADYTAAIIKEQHLTYMELNARANELARLLRSSGVGPDTIVGILSERSILILIGIFAILKAGGAYLPIDPDSPEARVSYMLSDSNARTLVTTSTLGRENKKLTHLAVKKDMRVIYIDSPDISMFSSSSILNSSTSRSSNSNLAYVIYTSGTTGKPKGVLINHQSAVNYTWWAIKQYVQGQKVNLPLFTPLTFDLTVTSIFTPLLSGNTVVIYEGKIKESLIGDIVEENRVEVVKLTPSHLKLILDQTADHFLSSGGKIKSNIKRFIVGGESLESKLAGEIVKKFDKGPSIYNEYGPTEATVGCMIHEFSIGKDTRQSVPIGIASDNVGIYLLDKNNKPVPPGAIGEICVAGESLARGYLNRPELTEERFINDPFVFGSRMYRTGDMARYLSGWNIEFLGRTDHQVKIRGFRIELDEIENQLLEHKRVKDSVVVLKEVNEDRYICAYIVPDMTYSPQPLDAESFLKDVPLRDYLSGILPAYMVPSFFISLEKIPLTPHGKVDQRALPSPVFKGGGTHVPPRDQWEEKLAKIWKKVLGMEKEYVGIDDNFFHLGGHSLKAAIMAAKIHKELKVKLPLAEVFKTPTIRHLSRYIRGEKRYDFLSIAPVETKEYYPLSSAQKRLYILQQMEAENTSYNLPAVVILEGELKRKKIEEVFTRLISRHESLRTSFEMVGDEPVQRVHKKVAFNIEYYDIDGDEEIYKLNSFAEEEEEPTAHGPRLETSIINNFIRSFELSQVPLLRIGLIKIETQKHILMVDMHHIISDAVSLDIFTRDFMALYAGEVLPGLRIYYKDYSYWQNREKNREKIKRQEDFWTKEFAGEIHVLDLFTDHPRPALQSFEGKHLDFFLDEEKTRVLKQIALEEDSTIYMVLIAIFNIFLAKLSGQENIIIGTPVAGRSHADLEQIVGMLVNTLALRNYPSGEKCFKGFLREVRQRTLAALENQDYQFEDLVEKVLVNQNLSRNPLFDVMFVLQNAGSPKIAIPGLKLRHCELETGTSKFDLTISCEEVQEKLIFAVEFNTKLFFENTIHQFINYFKKIVTAVLANKDIRICEIEIISEKQREQLLYDFNDTAARYPKDQLIHQLFETQVEQTPHHTALVEQIPNKDVAFAGNSSITYKELNKKSNQLAQLLKEKGVKPDTIVGLLIERSLEMIISILGILKAGGGYLPIDPDYPEERIHYMLADSAAKALVTTRGLMEDRKMSSWEVVKNLEILLPDFSTFPPFHPSSISASLTLTSTCQVSPANLTYTIYTSGSTGKPKGVLVEHSSVVNLVYSQKAQFDINENDRILQFSTICFDASVEQIFITLFSGAILVLIDKNTLLDIHEFDAFVSRNCISHIHAVPSFLNNMKLSDTSISTLKRVIAGGDICPVALAKTWSQYCDFYNKYGPTETTVTSIEMLFRTVDERLTGLPIGKPLNNTIVYLFDRWMKLVPLGVGGELYLGGDGVARGYLNRPELTAEKFCLRRPGLSSCYSIIPLRHSPIYRTGDLARWLPDGNIEFLGRLDHQVKVRGFRIELGEIENQLLKHKEIKEAAVTAIEDKNKYLAAYIVSDHETSLPQLREQLLKKLPDYMIPSYFIRVEKIPLTPNGKINRKALPKPEFRDVSQTYTGPQDENEKKLAEIWSEVLAVEKKRISIDDNFFHLGGHSLKAAIMAAKIHKELKVKLPLAEVFKTPTIRHLSRYIRGEKRYDFLHIAPAEKKEYYPLSSAQKRLYILQQMEADNTSYNLPIVVILEGELKREKIEEVFTRLISRHESLRTSLHLVNELPVQVIHDEVEFEIQYYDIKEVKVKDEKQTTDDSGNTKDDRKQVTAGKPDAHPSSVVRHLASEFIRPFDLPQAPLLRVGLINMEESKHLLMLDMHHIITDGSSQQIFTKEFMALYGNRGEKLLALRLQYKDFLGWEHSDKQREAIKKQEDYWTQQFAGEIPVLQLPTDYSRPAVQTFAGESISFEIDAGKTASMKQIALAEGATLYMVLLALYNILIAKLSGTEDIIIGTAADGRRHADLQQVIGMFVNTISLRNNVQAGKNFSEFLKDVKKQTLEAFENQDFPFEDLVEKMKINRDTARNPLFDVMFVLQNMDISEIEIPDLKLMPYPYETDTAKFDLTLIGIEASDSLHFHFEYSTALFKKTTIHRFIHYFKRIISIIPENPWTKLADIEIIPVDEKKKVLFEFNNTSQEYEKGKTIFQLFEEQAVRTPGNIAVVGTSLEISDSHTVSITYNKLNEKANQLTGLLRRKGVTVNRIVGLMVERSLEMIIGILGILKAGGAYLPIDPLYPPDRIQLMLGDSSAHLVLAQKSLPPDTVSQWDRLNMDELYLYSSEPKENLPHLSQSRDLAYVIFTSGSTGVPKGVMLEHDGISNLKHFHRNKYSVRETDKILQFAPLTFDASIWEIFMAILNGAVLCIPGKEVIGNYFLFETFLNKYQITIVTLPPAYANHLDPGNLVSLKRIITAGSSPTIGLVKKWQAKLNYINAYGPTEITICATSWDADQGFAEVDVVPIGIPISNTRVYILNSRILVQPLGIAGEICISGAGTARGYLNRPELTQEKFIENPYETGEHLYRTGDLGRWLTDGNIRFLGRIDHQLKVRGFRIEPEEIEKHLLKHRKIKEAVVLAREDEGGDQYLAAYIVTNETNTSPPIPVSELRDYLLNTLPDYMIPSYFVPLERLPLTSSGKIDRKALPAPGVNAAEVYIAPRDEIETILVKIWSQVLGRDASHASQLHKTIGIDTNFFECGGHSLKATYLTARIYKEFHIKIPLTEIFIDPTIRAISRYIRDNTTDLYQLIVPVEKREYYELSSTQKRFYILQQMNPGGTGYNIPTVFQLEGRIHKKKLVKTFRQLIERHESLRTSFFMLNQEPVQVVHHHVDFDIRYREAAAGGKQTTDEKVGKNLSSGFILPVDLSQAPLLRVDLVRLEQEKYILMVDMHHIISDGISMNVLVKEFTALYTGEGLPRQNLQYKDFAAWQNSAKKQISLETQEKYWLKEFAGGIPTLTLPTDDARPAIQGFEGATLVFEIDKQQKQALNSFAVEQTATLYMVVLALFNILLSRLSGQEKIVVGSPVAGRRHMDLEQIIGAFINTLPMKNEPTGTKSIKEFIKETKENALQAFANQDYPYEDMVEALAVERDPSRNPLFDVMFVFQDPDSMELQIPGLKLTPYRYETETSKFDLLLAGMEEDHQISFTLEYSTNLFKTTTIHRFISYFKTIVSSLLNDTSQRLWEIDILPEPERRKILFDFNDTAVPYPEEKTVYELFAAQAGSTPDNIAIKGMVPGTGTMTLSYRALNERTNRLARLMRLKGIRTNIPVGIMMEPSPDIVISILAILKAGGTYLPIDPQYPENRIALIAKTSGMNLLVSASRIIEKKLFSLPSLSFEADTLPVDELGSVLQGQSPQNLEPMSRPGDLIYIIFTSGSTGIPKGAGVYHRGFTNLMHWFVTEFALEHRDRNLLLTSLSFDLTQKNLYASLLTGGQTCLPDQDYFEPGVLLRNICEQGITWLNCTPGMFYKLVEYQENSRGKQLAKLRYVFLGGEPINITPLLPWLESDTCRAEVVNTYGPTECTDICASYRIRQPRRFLEKTIPVGQPVYNVQLYILDKHLRVVPIGVTGELLIGGAGIGTGYINDKELTSRKFIRHAFKPNEPEQLLYHTGDLVKQRTHGNIEFVGRIDFQVKVRGFRVETGEIESRLLSHQEVKETVVVPGEGENRDQYLCAYIVPHHPENFREKEIKNYLSAELPNYMVPSYFMLLEKIPLNPHGKVDRKALPEPAIKPGKDYLPPENNIETILVGLWSKILNLDKGVIGVRDNFFHLGGHSLKAVGLVSRIHKEFFVEVPLGEIFREPTIRHLSEYISGKETLDYFSIEPVEKKEYYALASAQKRLYILQQMEEENSSYNLPTVVTLEGEFDKEKIEEVFTQFISRHESLRTSFHLVDELPVQVVHDNIKLEIEYDQSLVNGHWALINCQSRGEVSSPTKVEKIIRKFIRPFDLSKAPLLRMGLIKMEEPKHLLMVDMHHIITDGISQEIFTQEFMALYGNKSGEIPALRLQYKDFSGWQNSRTQKQAIVKQEEYWMQQFAGEIPILHLPTDYPRPAVQRFEGQTISFEIGAGETASIRQIAQEHGATLYMILLAQYNILLSKLSGMEDIIIGTAAAGRRREDLEQVIGMFVNTLSIRNLVQAGKTFKEFLKDVKKQTLKAFENQDYQFEDLVEKVEVNRDTTRNPLFDVMFVLQNMNTSNIEVPGLKLTPYEYGNPVSKFDFTLTGQELNQGLFFSFQYCTELFEEETIHRFISYFKKIVSLIVREPDLKLWQIEVISEEEKRRLLYDFNDTEADYPSDISIQQLFEEQVGKTPDNIALVGPLQLNYRTDMTYMTYISYRELNERSNQLAHLLTEKGIEPDTIVGIIIGPSLEMIIGILGILKAGGGYLPIDPLQPRERMTYVLDDSRASLLLTSGPLAKTITINLQSLHLDDPAIYKGSGAKPKKITGSTHIVYTIYTSGTTGKSKGTLIENRNLVNYINWFKKKTNLGGNDRTVLTSSFAFDLGYTLIYSSLLGGCTLHIIPGEIYLSPENLIDYIARRRVTYIKVTPSLFSTIVRSSVFSKETCGSLRLVLLGGEEIKPADVKKAHALGLHMEIMNHYGPTEATIGCVAQFIDFNRLEEYMVRPTIGYPIDNMKVIILDRGLKQVPLGVPGELCISGAGVVRGYLNRPELTAEKFGRAVIYLMTNDRLYHTGDLARWLTDGSIEFLGRIDNQVKIRGYRIETGEIQNRLLKHKTVKEVAVIPLSYPSGDKYLCAYIVQNPDEAVAPTTLQTNLTGYLADKLPDYMVPSYFVTVDRIPLTPNGKLNRKLLPEPEIKIETRYAAPGDTVEETLVGIWENVLSPDSRGPSIGVDDNFFQRGGHSLTAIILTSRIHQVFQVNVPLAEIFKNPTVRRLSAYIKSKKRERYTSIEPVEEKNYYILSSAQKRLYILQQMDLTSTAYNMPAVIPLSGEKDIEKLNNAFKQLIKRHESFRTSFEMVNGEYIQQIHDEVDFKIEYYDLQVAGKDNRCWWEDEGTRGKRQKTENKPGTHPSSSDFIRYLPSEFISPFDLSRPPLLRALWLKTEEEKHLLLIDMHHIISDEVSHHIFNNDLLALYRGNRLPQLRLQYKDFSEWQNNLSKSGTIKKQEEYWLKTFEEEIPLLKIPTDYERPGTLHFEGHIITFEIGGTLYDKFKAFVSESKTTFNISLLAVYNVLLSKYTGQKTILVGNVIAGRKQADLQNIIGFFVNMLPIKNRLEDEQTFENFAGEVKETSIKAYENQDYQFEELVSKLDISREAGRHPLIDTVFVLQNHGDKQPPGNTNWESTPYEIKHKVTHFDLMLHATVKSDSISMTIEYSTTLFKQSTIETLAKCYLDVLEQAVTNKKIKLKEITISYDIMKESSDMLRDKELSFEF